MFAPIATSPDTLNSHDALNLIGGLILGFEQLENEKANLNDEFIVANKGFIEAALII